MKLTSSMRSACIVLFSLAGTSSCSEDMNPFYVVNDEVRTPVLQILQKSTSADSERPGCLNLATGTGGAEEKWCQQFPLRPETPVLLRFVVMSPEGGNNTVELVSISQLTGLQQNLLSARLGPGAGSPVRDLNLSDFSLDEREDLARVLSEKPLRVEERFFSMSLPSVDELFADFQSMGALPGYTLVYRSQNGSFRKDQGLFTFYVLPDPDSSVFRALATGQFSNGQAPSEETLEALRRAAATNTPPTIQALSPDGGALASGSENRLELTLGDDPDLEAKSRIQWFVSSGELSNMVSKRPTWKPQVTGEVSAFAMIRDLQGGSDFVYRVFESTP